MHCFVTSLTELTIWTKTIIRLPAGWPLPEGVGITNVFLHDIVQNCSLLCDYHHAPAIRAHAGGPGTPWVEDLAAQKNLELTRQ